MDLEDLGCSYEGAVRQIDVLDTCLTELLQRQGRAEEMDDNPEFGYLDFKIDVISGVKHMYEQFRDQKWTQLQQECARSLQEVLDQPATSTGSAYLLDQTTTTLPYRSEEETEEEPDLLVHQIPVPLTPIDDTETSSGDPRVPEYSLWGSEDMDMDVIGGFSRE